MVTMLNARTPTVHQRSNCRHITGSRSRRPPQQASAADRNSHNFLCRLSPPRKNTQLGARDLRLRKDSRNAASVGASRSAEWEPDREPEPDSDRVRDPPSSSSENAGEDVQNSEEGKGNFDGNAGTRAVLRWLSQLKTNWEEKPDPPWTWTNIITTFVLLLVMYPLFGYSILPKFLPLINVPANTPLFFLLLDFTLCTIFFLIFSKTLGLQHFPWRFKIGWNSLGIIILLALGTLLFPAIKKCSEFNQALLQAPGGCASPEGFIQSYRHTSFILLLALVAPCWEELVFRAFVLPALCKGCPKWLAIVLSSILFALAHFKAESALPLLVLGILFGVLFLVCRNLLPCIALHSMWNMYMLATMPC